MKCRPVAFGLKHVNLYVGSGLGIVSYLSTTTPMLLALYTSDMMLITHYV